VKDAKCGGKIYHSEEAETQGGVAKRGKRGSNAE